MTASIIIATAAAIFFGAALALSSRDDAVDTERKASMSIENNDTQNDL